MFESNKDFEFDEAIFEDPFEYEENKSAEVIPKPVQVTNLIEITPSKSFRSPSRKVVLRKFPGPAGVLPERKDFSIDLKNIEDVNNKDKNIASIDMDICSQTTANTFENNAWQRMKKDFDPSLLEKYNINWIKSKAQSSKLINQKAPFLAAIIQNMEILKLKTAVAKIIVKDPTDVIHLSLLVHDLYEEHLKDIRVGSVVVLKQFGVLTIDGSNHYINICANNLVAIYSSSGDNVKVVNIQNITSGDILKNINETKSRHKAMTLQNKLNPVINFENRNLRLQNEIYKLSTCNALDVINQSDINKASVKVKYDRNLPSFSSSKVSNIVENKAHEKKSKFNFKALKGSESKREWNGRNVSTTVDHDQSKIGNSSEKSSIIESVFEGVDTDLLFEDF